MHKLKGSKMLLIIKRLWKHITKSDTKIKLSKLAITETYPLSDAVFKEYLLKNKCCPDCKSESFYEGPTGGMSINIKCSVCGSFFNDSGLFGIERIHWFDHHNIAKDFTAYKAHTPKIINTWYNVYLKSNYSAELFKEIYQWCSTETSIWAVKNGKLNSNGSIDINPTFFFKEEDDAVRFKLTWA
jgi:hypothetical protein